jgi:hypothetical protein
MVCSENGRLYIGSMTPDRKFELIRTAVSIIPATVLSAWAFVHQRRQTMARLKVVVSPMFWNTLTNAQVMADDWPGIAVLNQSTFPLKVSNVGFRVGRKYFEFGKPLVGPYLKPAEEWPMEIAPRSRVGLYLDRHAMEGIKFVNAVPSVLKEKPVWEVGRAYAMTECSHTFISPHLSKSTIGLLSKARKAQSGESAKSHPVPQTENLQELLDKLK